MKPQNVTDLAGRRLSLYDVVDMMRDVAIERKNSTSVGITNHLTKDAVDAALARFKDSEKRDPSAELAELRGLAQSWGAIQWRVTNDVPDGTILFMDKDDYDEWQKTMNRAHAIINIGGSS